MMAHAFIFTSAADLPAARLCGQQLARLGWHCHLALDAADGIVPSTNPELLTRFPRRGKLNGSACMAGIFRLMLEHTPGGGIAAKIDADMFLTPAGSRWLMAAGAPAHGYSIAGIHWSGCWAATPATIEQALGVICRAQDCPTCPEAYLAASAFKASAGIRRAPVESVQVWRSGRALRPGAHLITLPSALSPSTRARELAELLALDTAGKPCSPSS